LRETRPSRWESREPDSRVGRQKPVLQDAAPKQNAVMGRKRDRIRGEVQEEGEALAAAEREDFVRRV
jgi:hypothetical protein